MTLSRKTMCDWMRRCADLASPIYERMKACVLGSKVMQTDDTPVNVLDPLLPRTRTGRIWSYYVGDRGHPYTVYDYTPTRSRDGPDAFMQEFHGCLQADAYSGYDELYRDRNRNIYRRYAIVARQDLVDGLKRLADYRATLDKTPAAQKVVPITSSML